MRLIHLSLALAAVLTSFQAEIDYLRAPATHSKSRRLNDPQVEHVQSFPSCLTTNIAKMHALENRHSRLAPHEDQEVLQEKEN